MMSTNSPTPFPGITPTLVRIRFTPTNPKFFTLVAGSPQLIVLYADWSPESNSIAPVINGLESRYSGQVNFVYLDLEDPANSLLKVLAEPRVPPIIFLLDGQGNILNYWRGLVEPLELEQALQLAIRWTSIVKSQGSWKNRLNSKYLCMGELESIYSANET